jgi:hypothetical protein
MKAPFPAVRRACLPLLALALSAPAMAQEPAPSPAEDVHEQMRKLIAQIEKGLGRVDKLLWSVDAPPGEGEHSSIAARLAAARARSQKVLDDIDLLLEIRHHPHDQGGGT